MEQAGEEGANSSGVARPPDAHQTDLPVGPDRSLDNMPMVVEDADDILVELADDQP